MKIIFISLYCFRSFPIRLFHTFTTNKGVEAHSIFFKNSVANTHKPVTSIEINLLLQLIEKIKPDLVAFSVLAPYAVTARQLVEKIRKISSAPIVLGGKYPTITPERALEFSDFICVGEGEDVLADMINCFNNGSDYYDIQGLWYKDSNNAIIDKGQRPLLQNLDDLPFPALNDPGMYFIENNVLLQEDPEIHEEYIFLMAGRGCVYQCSYCVNSLLIPMNKGNGKFVRFKTPHYLIEEIKYYKSRYRTASFIGFGDEVFGTNLKWSKEFCELFVAEQINMPFHIEIIPALIQEKIIALLAEIGLIRVNFGIQSGNDQIRNNVLNRPGSNAQLIEKASILSKYNIEPIYDIILSNPFETAEDKQESIKLLLTLPKPHHYNTFKMQFFPKYPFTAESLKAGFITEEELTDEAIAHSTMNAWAYIPKTSSTSDSEYIDNIVFLLAWNAPLANLISRRFIQSNDTLTGLMVNKYAKIVYLWFFSNQFRYIKYVYITYNLLKKGHVSEIWKKIIRKINLQNTALAR